MNSIIKKVSADYWIDTLKIQSDLPRMSSWANCSDDRTEVILMKRYACILVCTFLLSIFSPIATAQDDVVELYTLTGKVFDSEGNPGAETSIKVDSMTSSWSEDGHYTFTDITPGFI